ncbi:hypothetical protein Mycsm_07205 (plasmid) [Mycobacterium sp. JS623]|nr:hypothetical protein Mycsm_07205 [Mycobacterium sp. JS623]
MTRNGDLPVNERTDAGEVVEAERHRLRLWLIGALTALAIAAVTLIVIWPTPQATGRPAPCLMFGAGPVNNGKAVIAAGVATGVPESGILAGLTAAMQDTELRNLANPNVPDSLTTAHDGLAADYDALGILQQRAAWGTTTARMTPAAAAQHFYAVMRTIDGWQNMEPQFLASLVQRSAWPEVYATRVPSARVFYREHLDEVLATHCDGTAITAGAPS